MCYGGNSITLQNNKGVNLSDVIVRLRQLFLSFAREPEALEPKIREASGMKLEAGEWAFTIQGLYGFIYPDSEAFTFQQFQSQLYKSQLNQKLSAKGLQVVLHSSSGGKLKSNWYRLTINTALTK